MQLKATLVTPSELDAACLLKWEALRDERSCYDSPFYSPHFARAVGDVRQDARVAIFEKDGEVVGFLPFHLVRRGIAKPIGGHINDYHGPILRSDISLADPALLDAAGLAAYDFNHLPQDLGSALATAEAGGASPQMDLSRGYQASVEGKGSSWKRGYSTMARKLRKLQREVGETTFIFNSLDADHFSRHAQMRTALYRTMGMKSEFGAGWEGAVIDRLREEENPGLATVLNVLLADGEPVAAHFGLVSRGVMHWWFPAYAESALQYSPGISMLDFCARNANDHDVTTIDFGRGDDRYKLLFADRQVPLLAGSVTRAGSAAAILRGARRAALAPAERILPSAVRSYPRRITDRLFAGVVLPQSG